MIPTLTWPQVVTPRWTGPQVVAPAGVWCYSSRDNPNIRAVIETNSTLFFFLRKLLRKQPPSAAERDPSRVNNNVIVIIYSKRGVVSGTLDVPHLLVEAHCALTPCGEAG